MRDLAEAAAGLGWPVKLAGDARHPDGGLAEFENVEVLGAVPHDELLGLMRRAGLFVATPRYEPFGLAVAEAAAAGCPLLLAPISTFLELWPGAAFSAVYDERGGGGPDTLRREIDALIADPARRADLGAAARRRAAAFTPERQASAYRALYARLTTVLTKVW